MKCLHFLCFLALKYLENLTIQFLKKFFNSPKLKSEKNYNQLVVYRFFFRFLSPWTFSIQQQLPFSAVSFACSPYLYENTSFSEQKTSFQVFSSYLFFQRKNEEKFAVCCFFYYFSKTHSTKEWIVRTGEKKGFSFFFVFILFTETI